MTVIEELAKSLKGSSDYQECRVFYKHIRAGANLINKLETELATAMQYLGEVLDMVHGTTPVDRDRLDEIQKWVET